MLKDVTLKAKIFCMGGGTKVQDVTEKYRCATKLEKWNTKILESNCGMTYVVRNGRIVLKSATSLFKAFYSELRDMVIIKTYADQKEGDIIYELEDIELSMKDELLNNDPGCEISIMDELSGFDYFEEIEKYNLILLTNRCNKHSIIYDYNIGTILVEENDNKILWFEKIGVFLREKDNRYEMIIPFYVEGKATALDFEYRILEHIPEDECGKQLIGNFLIDFKGYGQVEFIYEFSKVEEICWLPKPCKYIVKKDNELYILAIAKGNYQMISIGHQYNTVKPLCYPEMSDYMIVTSTYGTVGIQQYLGAEIKTIAEYEGNDIKLLDPVLDLENSCIKIPIKVVVIQEKNLNECNE